MKKEITPGVETYVFVYQYWSFGGLRAGRCHEEDGQIIEIISAKDISVDTLYKIAENITYTVTDSPAAEYRQSDAVGADESLEDTLRIEDCNIISVGDAINGKTGDAAGMTPCRRFRHFADLGIITGVMADDYALNGLDSLGNGGGVPQNIEFFALVIIAVCRDQNPGLDLTEPVNGRVLADIGRAGTPDRADRGGGQHDKSVAKFKARVKELTCRSWGVDNKYKVLKLNELIRGWVNYFKIGSMKTLCEKLDSRIRCRLRMCIWKHWKTPKNRAKNLIKLGISRKYACPARS